MKLENKPMVSVIVPVYNVENFIERCLDSILEQEYRDFELLVIDDGSSDDSGTICDSYISKDSRVQVFHKQNGGLSDARNYGIEHARGEYYTFIDSDDYIGRDYLKILLSLIDENAADVAVVKFRPTYQIEKEDILLVDDERHVMDATEALKTICINTHFGVSACGKLYHHTLFDGIRYPKGYLYEDVFTTPYLIAKSSRVAYSNAVQYFWYQRPTSITHSDISDKNMVLFDGLGKLVNFIDENYPQLHDAAVCRYVNDSFWTIIQKLVYSDDYYRLIDRIDAISRDLWKEGLRNPYLSFRKKLNVIIMLVSKKAYRGIYMLHNSKNRDMI